MRAGVSAWMAAVGFLTAAGAAMSETPEGADEQRTDYQTVVMDLARLKAVKARVAAGDPALTPALDALRREADGWLTQGPFSVMRKTVVPPSGDKHDYLSFGPYWWPDPDKKDGLPYIRRDGEVNPQSVGPESDRAALDRMAISSETLALAWFFTGEKKYAERAALDVSVWFLDPETRMNPHLKYGQAIPGRCDGRGIGIIDTRRLVQLVNILPLLEDSGVLDDVRRQALKAWFASYLDWLCESENGREEARQANNHGTWYDVQVVAFARLAGRRELAETTLRAARQARLTSQVSPDGRQPHELARTRAMTYSLLNLSGFLALAEFGRQAGVDYCAFPSSGDRRLKAAVDLMAAYTDEGKPWSYSQITPLRRAALYPILRQASVVLGIPEYRVSAARLSEAETKADRANLLWP